MRILTALVLPVALSAQPLPHQRLVKDILEKYDPMVRPVEDPRKAVNVTFRLTLYQLLDVNEALQSVSLYCWLIESWYDEFIHWNPDAYGRQKRTVVNADMVWRPDTYLYNNVDMDGGVRITSAIVEMKPDRRDRAHIKLQYPAILKYSCKMFLLYFPFDRQNCSLQFASWVYDMKSIDYHPDHRSAHMDEFIPNSEWIVISIYSQRIEQDYSCCPNAYANVHYHLVMQRKPLFYVLNLILPTIIISGIALVGFFFPSHTTGEREQKVSLGITTLLSMSVFLLMVSDELPTTSDFVPYIGWFYIGVMGFIAFATLTTSVVIVIQQQGRYGRVIPPKLKHIMFNKVAKFIVLRPPIAIIQVKKKPRRKGSLTREECTTETLLNGPSTLDLGGNSAITTTIDTTDVNEGSQEGFINETPEMRKLQRDIRTLLIQLKCEQSQDLLELEWEWLATVVEQVVLAAFMGALLSFSLFMLLSHG